MVSMFREGKKLIYIKKKKNTKPRVVYGHTTLKCSEVFILITEK